MSSQALASERVKFRSTWDDLPECSREVFRQRGVHWFSMEFELPQDVLEPQEGGGFGFRGWVNYYSTVTRAQVKEGEPNPMWDSFWTNLLGRPP